MHNPKSRSKKIAPIVCAVLIITAVMLLAGTFLFITVAAWMESVALAVFFGVYVLSYLLIIGGVVLALVQRLKEIDGGEEDEASKY